MCGGGGIREKTGAFAYYRGIEHAGSNLGISQYDRFRRFILGQRGDDDGRWRAYLPGDQEGDGLRFGRRNAQLFLCPV